MIKYQRRDLATATDEGQPNGLPHNLRGLSDGSLANLSAALDPVPAEFAGKGFIPVVVPDPPVIPETITRTQFILALKAASRLAAARTAVNALAADDPLQVWFFNTASFRRDDARVEAIRVILGVTNAHVDAIFTAAGSMAP
jgi:hypothetical protein